MPSFLIDATPLTASDVGAYPRADVDDAIEAAKNGPLLATPMLMNPRIACGAAPATAQSPGVVGQIEWDSHHIYVCVEKNTWKRASLSTW